MPLFELSLIGVQNQISICTSSSVVRVFVVLWPTYALSTRGNPSVNMRPGQIPLMRTRRMIARDAVPIAECRFAAVRGKVESVKRRWWQIAAPGATYHCV